MGNRGNVVFTAGERISPAVYLHWNGGPESVYAFLTELDRRNVRADGEYEAARFVQLVGEFFDYSSEHYVFNGKVDRGLSLGILPGPARIDTETIGAMRTDLSDNGVYVVDRTSIPNREHDGPLVRRFTETDWDPNTGAVMTEMDPVAVERERIEAETQGFGLEYHDGIGKFFREMEERNLRLLVS